MSTPKISVIMPLYNRAKTVPYAMESILQQTFGDFELIIIDDGSTDNSLEVVKSYSDPRIIIIQQANQGISTALNMGLKAAQGEYIARQDSDDFSMPTRFAEQVAYLDRNLYVALLATAFYKITPDGENLGLVTALTTSWALRWEMLFGNPLGHTSVMLRRTVVEALGGYKDMKVAQDYELWSRLVYEYDATIVNRPLALWLVNPTGLSRSNIEARYRICQEIAQHNVQHYFGHGLPDKTLERLTAFWFRRREPLADGTSYQPILGTLDDIYKLYRTFSRRHALDEETRNQIAMRIRHQCRSWYYWLYERDSATANALMWRMIRYFPIQGLAFNALQFARHRVSDQTYGKLKRIVRQRSGAVALVRKSPVFSANDQTMAKADAPSGFLLIAQLLMTSSGEGRAPVLEAMYSVTNGSPLEKRCLEFYVRIYHHDLEVHRFALQQIKDSHSLLEIGCGAGLNRLFLTAKQVPSYCGLDFSRLAIKLAQHLFPTDRFLAGDVEHLGLAANSFDTVLSEAVVEHLESYEQPLLEMCRVASKTVILTFSRGLRHDLTDEIAFFSHTPELHQEWDYLGEFFGKSGHYMNTYSRSKLEQFITKYLPEWAYRIDEMAMRDQVEGFMACVVTLSFNLNSR